MNKLKILAKNKDFMHRYSSVIFAGVFLLLLNIVAAILSPSFLSARNISRLVESAFSLMMVAFGQSLCLLVGGIDISLGSILSLSNVICVTLMVQDGGAGWIPGVAAALAAGFICGMINGFLSHQFKLPALIVTISMQIVYAGLALYIMPIPTGSVNKAFYGFMKFKFFKVIPMATLLILLILIVMRIITDNTSFGKSLRAVGGSEKAAFAAGINVRKIRVLTFGLSGMLCGIGGIWMSVFINSGDPTIGTGMQMNAISASVIGGVSMLGAKGDLIGTVFGVIIFTLISNLLNLNGISTNYQFLIKGLILIVALAISSYKKADE